MPTYIERNSSDGHRTNRSKLHKKQNFFEFHYKHTLYIALDFRYAVASIENDKKMFDWLSEILEKSKLKHTIRWRVLLSSSPIFSPNAVYFA